MGLNEGHIKELCSKDIALIGIPFDQHSSFLQGAAKAPQLIVEAIASESANYFTESLVDLDKHPRIKWCGDAPLSDYWSITEVIQAIMAKDAIPFSLGGDHSITYPIIKSLAAKHEGLNILHFDAHADLYDELDGNKYSHGCPFARIMEEKLVKNLTQVGIRTMTQHQQDQADRFNVQVIQMKDWTPELKYTFDGPVYLSFDMDVLDPAFAPGISHYEPGGFSTREVIHMIQQLDVDLVGCDVVEYNPDRDINGMTAMVAAKIVKELLAQLL